ncbi:hypothetical protein KBX06_09365 [Micromonospora sp. C31]|nr:hypothetical protein [Micromonospora sp. C31]MBQ1073369.1 hypothetical protein [Micromonospora sp. C31]
MATDDLLARHRAVFPSWMPLHHDEPIEPARGAVPADAVGSCLAAGAAA